MIVLKKVLACITKNMLGSSIGFLMASTFLSQLPSVNILPGIQKLVPFPCKAVAMTNVESHWHWKPLVIPYIVHATELPELDHSANHEIFPNITLVLVIYFKTVALFCLFDFISCLIQVSDIKKKIFSYNSTFFLKVN